MIKDLFVPLLRSSGDEAALDAAAALARAFGARVDVLATLEHPFPLVTEFGYVPVETGQAELEASRAAAEAQCAAARQRLARAEVAAEVRLADALLLWSEETAALHARHADLSVLGRPAPDDGSPRFGLTFKALLMQSGRPVLVVPPGARLVAPARRAVIAWKPTAEAARAVHEALPLLAPGAELDVLMIDPEPGEGRHGDEPGADLAAHLARHGLRVTVLAQPREGRSEGAAILRHLEASGPDLLVMGGYGHPRWREVVLGGATRHVLDGMRTPVLFSH
jgi:nucleotide-binding universal stress UspA family protein